MSSGEPEYDIVQTKDLKKLPVAKLLEIIYQYNHEVTCLKSAIEEKTSELHTSKSETNELQDQINFIQHSNHALSTQLHSNLIETNTLREQLHSAETEIKRLKKETEASISKECNSKDKKSSKFNSAKEKGITGLKEEIKYLKSEISYKHTENSELIEEITRLKETIVHINDDNERLKQEIESFGLKTNTIKEQLIKKSDIFKDALKRAQKNISSRKEENNELKGKNKALEEEIAEIKNEYQQEMARFKYLRKCFEDQKIKTEIWEKKFEDLQQRYNLQHKKTDKPMNKAPCPSTSQPFVDNNNSLVSVFEIKKKLNLIYKDFIGEITKNTEEDASIYSLNSRIFSQIEQKLNELISSMQERIEENESSQRLKTEDRRTCQSYKQVVSSPGAKKSINERRQSCPRLATK